MASIVIIISLFLTCFVMEAKSENFATVSCKKPEIVAQYGTSTILDCVAQTLESGAKIDFVFWTLNETSVLTFSEGMFKSHDHNFQFTHESHWDRSNMNVSVLITNTNLSHAGDYFCEVFTDKGSGKAKVHLDVKSNYSKPVINSDPKNSDPDKEFTLTCEAHSGFPKGDIRWVINKSEWKKKPAVEVKQTPSGLYDLTSKLSFGPNSLFTEFVCEVYNAKGVKEGQETFQKTFMDPISGSDTKGNPATHIVAPVVVIGSLIVGLLVAILMCRRKQQKARRLSEAPLMNVPTVYSEENDQMV